MCLKVLWEHGTRGNVELCELWPSLSQVIQTTWEKSGATVNLGMIVPREPSFSSTHILDTHNFDRGRGGAGGGRPLQETTTPTTKTIGKKEQEEVRGSRMQRPRRDRPKRRKRNVFEWVHVEGEEYGPTSFPSVCRHPRCGLQTPEQNKTN